MERCENEAGREREEGGRQALWLVLGSYLLFVKASLFLLVKKYACLQSPRDLQWPSLKQSFPLHAIAQKPGMAS